MTSEKYEYYLNVPQDYNQLPVGFKSLGPGFDRYSEHHDIFFGNKLVHCHHGDVVVPGRAGAYSHTIYFTPIDHWNKIMEENKPKENKMKTIEEVVQIYNGVRDAFVGKRVFYTTNPSRIFTVKEDDIELFLLGGPGGNKLSVLARHYRNNNGYVIIIKDDSNFYCSVPPHTELRVHIPKIKVKNWKTGQEYDAEFHNDYVKFGCANILNTDIVDALTHIESFRQIIEYKSPKGMIIGDGIFTTEILQSLREQIRNNKK